MKTFFVYLLAAGLLFTVNCECNTTAAVICEGKRLQAQANAKLDFQKGCAGNMNFIICLTEVGCNDAAHASKISLSRIYIDTLCAGHMVTASMATMLLTVIAIILK